MVGRRAAGGGAERHSGVLQREDSPSFAHELQQTTQKGCAVFLSLSSHPGFLSLTDTLDQIILCWGGWWSGGCCPVHTRIRSAILASAYYMPVVLPLHSCDNPKYVQTCQLSPGGQIHLVANTALAPDISPPLQDSQSMVFNRRCTRESPGVL